VQHIISKRENYKELFHQRKKLQENVLVKEQLKSIQEIQLLHSVLEKRNERVVKKTLFRAYQESLDTIKQYSKSDFVFSKSIENLDFLLELFQLQPEVKLKLFDEVKTQLAIDFINYLKQHYSEKQVLRLFLKFREESYFKNNILDWRDSLRLVDTENGFTTLDKYFTKVKLTANDLHNELIRVFNMQRFELEAQEELVYQDKYLDACRSYKDLEFKLPHTMQELHLWAQKLHNCMFGYANNIKRGQVQLFMVCLKIRNFYMQ